MTERWTTTQVAEWCNIRPSTYRDYVSDGRAPGPLPERDAATGAKLYDADAVKQWHANRPGAGARTDLGQRGANLGQTANIAQHEATSLDRACSPSDQREQHDTTRSNTTQH